MYSAVTFPQWRFVEHHPEAKSRDPLQSELLNQESFRPADALVRESIQNSLDAKIPGVDKVRVRIYVSGAAGALSKDEAAPYFQGFWPHVQVCENGGQVASDLAEGACRFVVIEDFGTIGLTGDPAATRVPEGASNNYYYFLVLCCAVLSGAAGSHWFRPAYRDCRWRPRWPRLCCRSI